MAKNLISCMLLLTLLRISLNLKTGLIRLVMTNYYSRIKQYNKSIEYRYIII